MHQYEIHSVKLLTNYTSNYFRLSQSGKLVMFSRLFWVPLPFHVMFLLGYDLEKSYVLYFISLKMICQKLIHMKILSYKVLSNFFPISMMRLHYIRIWKI